MSALLQNALLRTATWLMWLATRFGRKRLERIETNALLAAAAQQALDDAEERRAIRPPAPLQPGPASESDRPAEPVEVPEGYVVMAAQAQLSPMFGNALLLVDQAGKAFVPIFVGGTEALSFRTRIEREPYSRPLTHDLIDRVLESIGARVLDVRVDELRGGTFYARLWLELADERRLELDARPSDAIILAVGAGAPIFVAQEVLAEAGRRFDGSELTGSG